MSGLDQRRAFTLCEYYLPHFITVLEKYASLKDSRAEQRAFVMERLPLVKKIQKVFDFCALITLVFTLNSVLF